MAQKSNVNLLEGVIWKQMLIFAGPIFISNLFSQLYNMINSVIVGNYVSKVALSAVSACSPLINIISMFFVGVSQSMGILSSNAYGAGEKEQLKKTIETGLVFSIAISLGLTLFVNLFCPVLLKMNHINADIFEDAMLYFRCYSIGYVFSNLYSVNTYLLRSLGDSRHTLYYSVLSTISNVLLGIFFVKGLGMKVAGVAFATVISQAIVCLLSFKVLFSFEDARISLKGFTFDVELTKSILKIGVPIALQNMLISISGVLVQSYTNQFSNEAIAGVGVAQKAMNLAQMISNSIAVVVTSFVGQNTGAKKYERVKEGIRLASLVSTILTVIACVLIFILANPMVAIFNSDPDIIYYGTNMVRYCIFGTIAINFSHIYNAACRGCGNIRIPLIIAILGQVVFRYLAILVLGAIRFDIKNVYASLLISQIVSGTLATLYFRLGSWTKENQLRD